MSSTTQQGAGTPPTSGPLGGLDLAALAALATLAFVLHRDVLGQWWTHEDGLVLLFALGRSPLELLFDPAAWQEFSTAGFFPLLPISFRLDHALAGLSPSVAYGHQLASAGGAAALLYLYVRSFAGRIIALLAAASVIAAPLMSLVVRQGMVRNYIEGLLLTAAALLLWRRRTLAGATGAAVLWIAAALCKEAWILAPLFMLADSVASREPLRRVTRRAIPLAAAGAIFLAWRSWMLGSAGGYRSFPPLADLVEAPAVFWESITLRTPDAWSIAWAAALVLLGTAALVRLRARAALIVLLAAFASIAPFIPVMELFFFRYGFVAGIAAIVLGAAAASLLPRPVAWLPMAAIFVAALLGGLAVARAESSRARFMGAAGRYIFTAAADAPPLLAGTYGPHVEGIVALRRLLGRGEAPRVFLSDWALILETDVPPRVAVPTRDGRIAFRPTAAFAARLARGRTTFRPADPLRVEITRAATEYRWSYGPPGARRWNVLTWPMYEVRGVPAEGWLRAQRPLTIVRPVEEGFRVRRIAPDGTWTVSPVLPIRPGTIRWSR